MKSFQSTQFHALFVQFAFLTTINAQSSHSRNAVMGDTNASNDDDDSDDSLYLWAVIAAGDEEITEATPPITTQPSNSGGSRK
jgi:hypothetical protein